MISQPKALILADDLDAYHIRPMDREAAAELRRLHAENSELLDALDLIANTGLDAKQCRDTASAAIAKATGENK